LPADLSPSELSALEKAAEARGLQVVRLDQPKQILKLLKK
jgi:hypothetical protein